MSADEAPGARTRRSARMVRTDRSLVSGGYASSHGSRRLAIRFSAPAMTRNVDAAEYPRPARAAPVRHGLGTGRPTGCLKADIVAVANRQLREVHSPVA